MFEWFVVQISHACSVFSFRWLGPLLQKYHSFRLCLIIIKYKIACIRFFLSLLFYIQIRNVAMQRIIDIYRFEFRCFLHWILLCSKPILFNVLFLCSKDKSKRTKEYLISIRIRILPSNGPCTLCAWCLCPYSAHMLFNLENDFRNMIWHYSELTAMTNELFRQLIISIYICIRRINRSSHTWNWMPCANDF